MSLFRISTSKVQWYLPPDWRSSPIRALGCELVNPLWFEPDDWENENFFDLRRGGRVFASRGSIFLRMDAAPEHRRLDFVRRLLQRLRFVSGQAWIDQPMSFSMNEVDEADMRSPPELPETEAEVQVLECTLRTAITPEHLERIDHLDPDGHAWTSYLIDSAAAWQTLNWSRMILSAAIALDAYVRERILTEAQLALRDRRGDPALRIRGDTDPVMDALMPENARFETLLDVAPLYLLGRSLRLDNPGLLDRALRLYRTRNRLVHRGEVGAHLAEDRAGGSEALRTAVEVLGWWGVAAQQFMPALEHVRF